MSKKKIVIIGAAAVFIVLLVLLGKTLGKPAENTGLLKPEDEPIGEEIIEYVEDYETDTTKEEYSNDLINTLQRDILTYLSKNDVEGADEFLQNYQENYRNQEEGGLYDYEDMIATFRADLAVLKAIKRGIVESQFLSQFQTSEGLASAFIYTPLSAKMDNVLWQDSILHPAVQKHPELVNLTRVELTAQEKSEILGDINNVRIDKMKDVAVYKYHAFEEDCTLTLVLQPTYFWAVWDLKFDSGNFCPVIVRDLKKGREEADFLGHEYKVDAIYDWEEQD